MAVLELSRRDAARVAVRAQLLSLPRPTDLLEVVRHLGFVQADPTAAVAPSAELVAWSRLGSSYRLGELEAALDAGDLVELEGRLRPADDIALFRAEMAAWPAAGERTEWQDQQASWVEANEGCRRDILDKLHDEGPLPARALPDTTVVPWRSSGWNDDRNVRMLVQLMVRRGEVAMAGREGRERVWDLAERVYPDVAAVPLAEALRTRAERRLRALGIARGRGPAQVGEQEDLSALGVEAVVEGVRGRWRVDPVWLDDGTAGPWRGRTALLSPLDRLVFDRKRTTELFAFDYQLEMYKPAARRRWGYWAMPVLHGERLVGKLDATAERDAGVLRVDAVHEDGDWSARMRAAVRDEVEALGAFLGLVVEGPQRTTS